MNGITDGAVNGMDGAANGMDGAVNEGDGGSGMTDAGAAMDGGIAAQEQCLPGCTTVDDCDRGTPAEGPDNHTCTDGACEWTGCNSADECPGTDYVCDTLPGFPIPSCHVACTMAEECYIGGMLYDTDNFECYQGKCRWMGCNSDAECMADNPGGSYVCKTLPGSPTPDCYQSCTTVSDCVGGAAGTLYDEDNYRCDDGACVWSGCNSTDECTAAFSNADYVCH